MTAPTMSTSKGQTTLDFTIGISVFLIVLIFVFTFVPGLLTPFTTTNEQAPALSDRLADKLSQGMLGDPAEPYVLNTTCAANFFNGSSPGDCRYDGTELYERLDIKERTNVNVTLEGNVSSGSGSTVLCWDDTNNKLVELGSSDCDTGLVVGDSPPPDNDATVTARRVVYMDGEDVTMKVVVW
jgi:hypothetical protein